MSLRAATVKEVLSGSRRGQTYAWRVAYVAIAGALLYPFCVELIGRASTSQTSEYAAFGRELFMRFAPLQMALVTIASLGASADRIVKERRSGTLSVLLTTPLSAAALVHAKWRAAMIQSGSLVLAGVPALALCVYLGLAWEELLWCTGTTVSMAMLGSAFGLRASAYAGSAAKAAMLAVLYLVGYLLMPLAVVLMGGWPAIFACPYLNPFYTAGHHLLSDLRVGGAYAWAWVPAWAVTLLVARWVLKNAAGILAARALPDGSEGVPEAEASPFWRKWISAKGAAGSQGLWDRDPLLWKEYVTRPAARWTASARLVVFGYGSIFAILVWAFTQGRSLPSFLVLVSGPALIALAGGAVLFGADKEGRRMDLLLSTPLSTARLVLSKVGAGAMGPESALVLLSAAVLALMFSWWAGLPGVLVYVLLTLLTLPGLYLVGAWASLRARGVPEALLLAGGAACAILVLLPLVVGLAAPSGRALPAPLYVLACLNPVFVLSPFETGGLLVGPEARNESVARLLFFATWWLGGSLGGLGWMAFRGDRSLGRL